GIAAERGFPAALARECFRGGTRRCPGRYGLRLRARAAAVERVARYERPSICGGHAQRLPAGTRHRATRSPVFIRLPKPHHAEPAALPGGPPGSHSIRPRLLSGELDDPRTRLATDRRHAVGASSSRRGWRELGSLPHRIHEARSRSDARRAVARGGLLHWRCRGERISVTRLRASARFRGVLQADADSPAQPPRIVAAHAILPERFRGSPHAVPAGGRRQLPRPALVPRLRAASRVRAGQLHGRTRTVSRAGATR